MKMTKSYSKEILYEWSDRQRVRLEDIFEAQIIKSETQQFFLKKIIQEKIL